MSLSNSRKSYDDCYKLLDQALEQERGIRIELSSTRDATYLRLRIHHARQIDRTENAFTYEIGHPLHARSPYDILVCRIEGDGPCWLYLDKQKVEIGRIEVIPEGHHIEGPAPMLQIEHRPMVREGIPEPEGEPTPFEIEDPAPAPTPLIRRR